MAFWGCDKADEAVGPAAKLQASQTHQITEGGDADCKYKLDLTGQYVSKDVQITGYEDGANALPGLHLRLFLPEEHLTKVR